jgi:hypothetical protein
LSFLQELLKQLGMQSCPSLAEHLLGLDDIKVPRMLFPYDKLPPFLKGYAGCIKRMRNMDKCDLLIACLDEKYIRVEAKDRDKLTGDELITAAEKLFKHQKEWLGILVVRNCCDYWKEGQNANITRLCAYLKVSKNVKKIKQILFVRDGCFRHQTFDIVGSERTLLVIQTNLTDF